MLNGWATHNRGRVKVKVIKSSLKISTYSLEITLSFLEILIILSLKLNSVYLYRYIVKHILS